MNGEKDSGKGYGYHVGNRLCRIYANGGVSRKLWHDIDQWQKQHKFSDHRHDDGGRRISERNEGHLTSDLDTEDPHPEEIGANDARRKVKQGGVGGEDGGKEARKTHHDRENGERITKANEEKQAEGRLHAGGVLRPEVVAEDGLCPLGNSLQGQKGKLHDRGKDGHGTHGDIAAVF